MATQEASGDDVCPFCQIADKQTNTEILFSVSGKCSSLRILCFLVLLVHLFLLRLRLEFGVYKMSNDLQTLIDTWCFNNVLCSVDDNNLHFSSIVLTCHFVCPQDEELLCFRDVKPGAETHFLVVTRRHIDNCRMLQTQHIPLGEESWASEGF